MRIFVTGGTGFVGSHFLKQSIESGHEVIALRRNSHSKTRIELETNPIWLNKGYNDLDETDFDRIDCLVHLAAHSVQFPFDTTENCLRFNLTEPLAMLRQAIGAGVKRFIVTGSCFEYGLSAKQYDAVPPNAPLFPTNTYAVSKAAATIAFIQLAIECQLSLEICRLFHVYGTGEASQRFWPSLVRAAKCGEDFEMTRGNQIRDFIPVEEAATAILSIAENTNYGYYPSIRNIGTGIAQSLASFANSQWNKLEATGNLIMGTIPERRSEDERLVADANTIFFPR